MNNIPLKHILFLDIETVPAYATFDEVPEKIRKLWEKKAEFLKKKDNDTADVLYDRAGIYAEFGKVICISVGFFTNDNFRIKSFYGDEEKQVLQTFSDLLDTHYSDPEKLLCAHNGKEFDFPYLSRRMLINGLPLPDILQLAGKKPWEVRHLDTMELWKFGDFKNYTSLELLAAVFNIPTPKDDIDGSEVGRVYWQENDLERIVTYCQKDVLTIAQLFLKFQGKPLLEDHLVTIV